MKTFRDPIHNIIQFDKDAEKLILNLMDTEEFQRLRHIKQLGMTSMTFPGAEHSRFTHSIGVTHVMKRFVDRIADLKGDSIKSYIEELQEHKLLASTAALLHDIGHGPFSHALEKTTKIRHEKWTVEIILGDTQVNEVLEKYRPGFAKEVADVIKRTHPSKAVVKLLSSQLDVDRIDYLLRDSKMTGVGYGYFDLEWMIHLLRVGEVNGEIEAGLDLDKGLSIAEDFIMARYYMYVNIYLHKTSRGAELLIDKIFERAVELNKQGELELPEDLYEILSNGLKKETIANYLKLTDNVIWFYLHQWKDHKDFILSDLSSRLIYRKLYKMVSTDMNNMEIYQKINKISEEKGIPHKYLYLDDEASSSPYQDTYILKYKEEGIDSKNMATEEIILFDKKGKHHELSNVSDIIRQIRNKKILIPRVFVPAEYLDQF